VRILWVTFAVLGKASELFYGKISQGGGWIDACANHLLPNLNDSSLTILSLGKTNREKLDQDTGILYIECSDVQKRRGNYRKKDTEKWRDIIYRFSPDIIQVFGTEFSNGLNIIEAAENIPVLFYIQGIMASFEPFKFGGLEIREMIRSGSIHSFLKAYKFKADYKMYLNQMPYEAEMIRKCQGVIVDGEWSKFYLQKYNQNVRVLEQYLPISAVYQREKWTYEKCDKNTIFTIAGRTPYKGLHNLIKALSIVRETIPEVKLFIPGNMGYKSILSKPPYVDYLEKLIKRLRLSNNIVFCGQLTSQEMSKHMLSANVFVMPSCVENHSSTLREAMFIGVPCITSSVGCIPEIARYGENLLTYRYPEINQLAGHIIFLLSDKESAIKIGKNGYVDIREKYNQEKIGNQIINNYVSVISEYSKLVE